MRAINLHLDLGTLAPAIRGALVFCENEGLLLNMDILVITARVSVTSPNGSVAKTGGTIF